jgi:multidrug efflux pump subunit AcrA (membrane-fusion protein)
VRRPLNTPDARKINEAKLSFSLCDPNKTIGDIDRVMVSIVSSKPSFQSVKALIARNLVAADQFHEPIDRTGMFDSKQWELQRTLLDQSRRLMKQRSELTQMQTADAIIENIDEQLAMVKADASFTLASHQQTMATASEKAQQLKQQLDGFSHQFKQSQFVLQGIRFLRLFPLNLLRF